jgi:predicted AAA+ superfamily ATPase
MFINRKSEPSIRKALQEMPVTALLGPRQCGKTTLAKTIINGRKDALYLDLERPDDFRALSDPQAFFRMHGGKLICLDEIQRVPEIFPVIRTVVDDAENRCSFLILGSASPRLLRQSSESLAGRIRYIELTPFLAEETAATDEDLRKLWLRGGFPRSYLAKSDDSSFEWREDFVRTFLERDIPSLGFRIPAEGMRRFWSMLSHLNAQVLNRSRLGESLGITHHAVQHHLDILTGSYMVRSLQPFEANVRKRLVKSPKIYFRDTGILHALSGIRTGRQLLSHPSYGSSWEGFALESICASPEISRRWRPFFYGAHGGGEIDLILDDGIKKIAIEFKASSSPTLSKDFFVALSDTGISTAWVVAPVVRPFPLKEGIMVGTPMDCVRGISGDQTQRRSCAPY